MPPIKSKKVFLKHFNATSYLIQKIPIKKVGIFLLPQLQNGLCLILKQNCLP